MLPRNAVIELANHGYFFDDIYDRKSLKSNNISIRMANFGDIDDLVTLEQESWLTLAPSKDLLTKRLKNYNIGQWVALIDGSIKGALYTQRIASNYEVIEGMTFSEQQSLHTDSNPVLQLLGVSVKPTAGNLQIGYRLRNFVLQIAMLDETIFEVIAMTRCFQAAKVVALEGYDSYVRSCEDRIIKFHTDAGAKILSVVANYRSEDQENYGHAILVQYSIRSDDGYFGSLSRLDTANMAGMSLTTLVLRDLIAEFVGQSVTAMDIEKFLDTSFMDIGLDSLQMTELSKRLAVYCDDRTESISTIMFDFPTPRDLLRQLSPATQSRDPITLRSPMRPEVHSPSTLAICGISCRLPGQTDLEPESFFESLCSKLDSVSSVPDAWTTKTRHAAFISDHFAETFDPAYFGINTAEAVAMDPMQRLLLEVGHEALVEAGVLASASQSHERIGVFIGMCNNEWVRGKDGSSPYVSTGSAQSIAANRLSFSLGLRGPSMVIDTACSSSLVALHTACNAIKCGDCDTALVASADLILSQFSIEVKTLKRAMQLVLINISF